jgi:hypothetical protein
VRQLVRKGRRPVVCFLAAVLVLSVLMSPAGAANAKKQSVSRTIAIVFDNSGSMYAQNSLAWCRATYAMEVFASMMNEGDTLQIYPMWDVTVDSQTYSSSNPVTVKGGGDTSVIRKILTPNPDGTPIETIAAAYHGLMKSSGDEKWMIVLTDGSEFYEKNKALGVGQPTKTRLEQVLTQYQKDVNILYLGIGANAAIPSIKAGGNRYFADLAANSVDILSKLTNMCNMIFGRDALKTSGEQLNFDVSMSKLIVFVQGSSVGSIELLDSNGNKVDSIAGQYTPKYSELGSRKYTTAFDSSLQGVIVTYLDLEAGQYTLHCAGNPSSVGVYYEPDVDLQIALHDENGDLVNAGDEVHPGTYSIAYGMVDKNGNETHSALLGKTEYDITYNLNGTDTPVKNDQSGAAEVQLKADDVLNVSGSVTYLGSYRIDKTADDLGWPSGGFHIMPRPAGDFQVSLSGGTDKCKLSQLENTVYQVGLLYEGQPLTGKALDSVELQVTLEGGNAEYHVTQDQDGYAITIGYHGSAPETDAGDYQLHVSASYQNEDGQVAQSEPKTAAFTVEDDSCGLEMKLKLPQHYYEIPKLDRAAPILAVLSKDGAALTDEELSAVKFTAACGDLPCSAEPLPGQSAFSVSLPAGQKIRPGVYSLRCSAETVDPLGQPIKAEGSENLELQMYPAWLRYCVIGLAALLLILLLLLFLNTKVLPKKISVSKTIFTVDGTLVAGSAPVSYVGGGKKRGSLEIKSPRFAPAPLANCGLRLTLEAISPRREKSSSRAVKVVGVTPVNVGAVNGIHVGAVSFSKNMTTGKFEKTGANPKDPLGFEMRNGARCIATGEVMGMDGGTTAISLVVILKYY